MEVQVSYTCFSRAAQLKSIQSVFHIKFNHKFDHLNKLHKVRSELHKNIIDNQKLFKAENVS